MLLALVFGACLRPSAATPAFGPHSQVELVAEDLSVRPGRPFRVGLRFRLEKGWHIYWKNPGDSGTPPSVAWSLPSGWRAGDIQWPAPERLPSPPLMNFGYRDRALLPVVLEPPPSLAGRAVLRARVDWLVCREECLPASGEVRLDLPARAGTLRPDPRWAQEFARAIERLPAADPGWVFAASRRSGGIELAIRAPRFWRGAIEFFPEDEPALDDAAPQTATLGEDGRITLTLRLSELAPSLPRLRGVLVAQRRAIPIDVPVAAGGGLARAASLAFLGGLLLNVMPCVFPILSIKILGFAAQAGSQPAKLRRHGLAYGLGILASFWALAGALLALRAGGQALGWGFQLQSPAFVLALLVLFLVLSLNLLGAFELGTSLTRTGGWNSGRSGYVGSFLGGCLAVVAATPCTAPFMGTALGLALSQPAAAGLLVFSSLALGMAAPYVVFSWRPAWLRALPRPGPWMQTLKRALALPLLATVAWLAWILALQTKALRPRSGRWEPFSARAVAQARAERPVFVDFTAAWCVTCQVNERLVLDAPEVQAAFRDRGVILLKADWTSRDPAITSALASLGRAGVPVYALYAPRAGSPALLPAILTQRLVLDALGRLSERRMK